MNFIYIPSNVQYTTFQIYVFINVLLLVNNFKINRSYRWTNGFTLKIEAWRIAVNEYKSGENKILSGKWTELLSRLDTISYYKYLGFEVLTAVDMKSSIFWDITMCSQLKVNRRFRWKSPRSSGPKNKPSKKPAWSRQQTEPWRITVESSYFKT
jgi:hypothetical protein